MARRHLVGRFPSVKMDRMMRFNSSIECDMIYWLDFSPPVASFKEQPFTILYHKPKRSREYRYTPDFCVETDGGEKFVIECKPHEKIHSDRNREKFGVGEQWCEENNATFVVVTDDFLRQGVWLENVKELALYARYPVLDGLCMAVQHALLQQGVTIGEAALHTDMSLQETYPLICALIFHQQLHIPLFDEPVSLQTPLLLHPKEPYLWLPAVEVL